MNEAYGKLMDRVKDVGRMHAVEQLLDWDQETYMPAEGVKPRAELTALVSGLAHERLISDETRKLLDDASSAEDDHVAQTNLRETRRAFDRASRIPTELVKEIAHAGAIAKSVWAKAREQSRFMDFAPHLEKLLELKRRVAEHVGYESEPYDALMDEFEPGARASELEELFSKLGDATAKFLRKLMGAPQQPDASVLTRNYPRAEQEELSRRMAEALNFDFGAGRIDVTVHPFCLSIGGARDVRITTRYEENFLPAAMFGTMHETGHALYEQGLPSAHTFTPAGEAVSLGIHESQSRMWENLVGRSRAFWTYHFDYVKGLFPEALGDVALEQFYRAINTVKPSFIRVEADELTYNLHIALRFQIERSLIAGDLTAGEAPEAWNAKMKELLGITPESDSDGCLQDIHWSMGIFGYFPTYALGNLYAAQFFEQARKDISDLDDHIAANDHKPLLTWLRENIHGHGQRFCAGELVQRVTGKPLSIEPFMSYVLKKFSAVYGLSA